ncbi:MAG: SDR family NAD(P)-dependent oxidoreductase [Lachnospiraceae bacterium]|nr:SDR family NAD(P)-dependent oxidoreductase [Lachnospiraceae bacterium]
MKKALITGASRGIGRALAERFMKEYELYLICHTNSDLMADLPGVHFSGDIGDFGFVSKVFEEIPQLDLLINNAGIAYYGLLQDMDRASWDKVINTDLTSAYNTSHFAANLMVKVHSGRIINISSQWGCIGASCEVAYSAAKGGINAFTKALAKELAPSGIAVNALALGMVDTDMNNNLNEDEIASIIEEIPAGRICSPSEAAEAVYLLSKMPTYLTGQIISMNGGW